jgi:hypothetical protein
MSVNEVLQKFHETAKEQTLAKSDSPITMSVVVALTELMRLSTASTLHNLLDDIKFAVEEITKCHNSIEVKSASELFTGFVTRKCNDLQLV